MSLEYYIFCKNNYSKIISNLENIIDIYDSIINNTYSQENLDINTCEIFEPEKDYIFFIDKLSHIKQLKKICDNKIITICKHEFVHDLIDITPDRSDNITYCKFCGYTK